MRIPWLLIIFLGGAVAIGLFDNGVGCPATGCEPVRVSVSIPAYAQTAPAWAASR
jgi:hypothetical protein